MRFLLVNPWIADFAAFNFWIRPLGLYCLASWLDSHGAETLLLDCLSPFTAPGRFRRKPVKLPLDEKLPVRRAFARYGISTTEFRKRLRSAGRFDAVFITSVMSYWYPGVKWVVREIRKEAGSVPIILGGIYATLWKEHAERNLEVDLVCSGPLEENQERIENLLGLGPLSMPGRPWYRLGLHDRAGYGAVRTTTGCPFRCTYCASAMISGPFGTRDMKEVLKEILFLWENGVRQLAFYDDALLVDFHQRLGPLLNELDYRRVSMEFHTPNGIHARLVDEYVAKRLVMSGFGSVRLSLETVDSQRQKNTGGKVTSDDLERAVKFLLDAGMNRESIGVYLMVGLPMQEFDEVAESIRYVKSLGVRPYLAEFSPIPGTVEWKRLEENGIVTKAMDPLLTNNTVFFRLFSGYDMERFRALKRLAAS